MRNEVSKVLRTFGSLIVANLSSGPTSARVTFRQSGQVTPSDRLVRAEFPTWSAISPRQVAWKVCPQPKTQASSVIFDKQIAHGSVRAVALESEPEPVGQNGFQASHCPRGRRGKCIM